MFLFSDPLFGVWNWVDAIIRPEDTRAALLTALAVATRFDEGKPFKTGVLQV